MDNSKLHNLFHSGECIPENELDLYSKGEFAGQEANRIERHLIDCDACGETVEGLQLYYASSENVIPPISKKNETVIPITWGDKRNYRKIFSYAAAALILIGLGALSFKFLSDFSKDSEVAIVQDLKSVDLEQTPEEKIDKKNKEEQGSGLYKHDQTGAISQNDDQTIDAPYSRTFKLAENDTIMASSPNYEFSTLNPQSGKFKTNTELNELHNEDVSTGNQDESKITLGKINTVVSSDIINGNTVPNSVSNDFDNRVAQSSKNPIREDSKMIKDGNIEEKDIISKRIKYRESEKIREESLDMVDASKEARKRKKNKSLNKLRSAEKVPVFDDSVDILETIGTGELARLVEEEDDIQQINSKPDIDALNESQLSFGFSSGDEGIESKENELSTKDRLLGAKRRAEDARFLTDSISVLELPDKDVVRMEDVVQIELSIEPLESEEKYLIKARVKGFTNDVILFDVNQKFISGYLTDIKSKQKTDLDLQPVNPEINVISGIQRIDNQSTLDLLLKFDKKKLKKNRSYELHLNLDDKSVVTEKGRKLKIENISPIKIY